jgi:hypothetical protein
MASASETKQFFGTADAVSVTKIQTLSLGFHARELWKLHLKYGNLLELLESNIYWQILENWKGCKPISIAPPQVDQVNYYLHSDISDQ